MTDVQAAELEAILRQLVAADAQALRATVARLALAAVAAVADAVAVARRVDIFGGTGSALVGAQLRAGLQRMGIAAWCWTDLHEALASAATLGPADVAIGLSDGDRDR